MSVRTLIASFEVPGQGGAATSAYALFKKMRSDGCDVRFVSVVERAVVPYYTWTYGREYHDPDRVGGASACIVDRPLYRRHEQLVRAVEEIAPQVILARGYVAASLLKAAAPSLPVVLSGAGSHQAEFSIRMGRVRQAVDVPASLRPTSRLPWPAPGREKETLAAVDSILPNSPLSKALYETLFGPDIAYKVHPHPIWPAEWVVEGVRSSGVVGKPFHERSTDVLFAVTDWSRHEKNWPMVTRLVTRLAGSRVKIAGETPHAVRGAELTGRIISRTSMFELLADAKVVVAPSLVDACPTTLFEAAALGCNVVATKNCGNWMLCNERLLADALHEDTLVRAITSALEAKLPDNLGWFLEQGSYAQLREVLDAIGAQ